MIRNVDYRIKCGTGGHWDEDGCDLLIFHMNNPSNDIIIPRIGETVRFRDSSTGNIVYLDYLVNNVTYIYENNHDVDIEVAILPIGHSV